MLLLIMTPKTFVQLLLVNLSIDCIIAKEIEALLGVFKIQDIWVKQHKGYFGEKLM